MAIVSSYSRQAGIQGVGVRVYWSLRDNYLFTLLIGDGHLCHFHSSKDLALAEREVEDRQLSIISITPSMLVTLGRRILCTCLYTSASHDTMYGRAIEPSYHHSVFPYWSVRVSVRYWGRFWVPDRVQRCSRVAQASSAPARGVPCRGRYPWGVGDGNFRAGGIRPI